MKITVMLISVIGGYIGGGKCLKRISEMFQSKKWRV